MAEECPSVYLTIRSRLDNVRLVGLAVNRLCEYHGMSFQSCHDVELSVVEALTNAIRHGYKGEPDQIVVLKAMLFEDRIQLTVRDRGCGLPPSAAQRKAGSEPGPMAVEELQEGGWGLAFIHHFMDEVEYVDDEPGTTLVLTKFLTAESVPQAQANQRK